MNDWIVPVVLKDKVHHFHFASGLVFFSRECVQNCIGSTYALNYSSAVAMAGRYRPQTDLVYVLL